MGRLFPTTHLLVNRLAIGPLDGVTRRNVEALAVESITNANADRIDVVQPIQVSDCELVDPVNHRCVTGRNSVKPTTAAGPSGRRAQLAARLVAALRDPSIFCRP